MIYYVQIWQKFIDFLLPKINVNSYPYMLTYQHWKCKEGIYMVPMCYNKTRGVDMCTGIPSLPNVVYILLVLKPWVSQAYAMNLMLLKFYTSGG